MPRRSKGPRIVWRPDLRDAKGKLTHHGAWIIRDGDLQRGTGLGSDATAEEKNDALRNYLTGKHVDTLSSGTKDPAKILISDVLLKYVTNVVDRNEHGKHTGHARPDETKARIQFLRGFFGGDKKLTFINGDTCRKYIEKRSTASAARRELEELRAAVNYHRKEGLCDQIVAVVLPGKSKRREAFFEREQAAAAIWAAWRYREVQKGQQTDKRSRRHIARFMVFARYMGSRPGVVGTVSIEKERPEGLPWCDLRHGMFYGLPEGQRVTKKRRQTGRIPKPLLGHLRRWQRSGLKYVAQFQGQPVARITKAHNAVMTEIGLNPKRYTPHIWRHTVATWLMLAGADPWKSARFLAMSLETLIGTYGHHRPDDSAAVHGALQKKLELTVAVS